MRSRVVLAATSCAASVAVFLSENFRQQAQYDDAYITYRYSRNLVEGHGLVYNVGEYVEGITNLLWALLIATGMWLGLDAEVVAHGLGVAFGAIGLLVSYVYARALVATPDAWLPGITPWIVLSFAPYAYCATSGMESTLFAVAVTAALAAHAGRRVGLSAVLLVIATWTRPDGILVAAVVLGHHLLRGSGSLGRRLAPALAYAVAMLALTGFRVWYYGSPVPNTFYAKVGGASTFHVMQRFRAVLLPMAPLAIAAVFAVVRNPSARAGGAFAALYLAYLVAVGVTGDRFVLPLVPILGGLAVAGAAGEMARSRPAGIALVGLILSTVAWWVFGWPLAVLTFGLFAIAALWAWPGRESAWLVPAAGVLWAIAVAGVVLSGASFGIANLAEPLATSTRAKKLHNARQLDRGLWAVWRRHGLELGRRADEFELVGAAAIGAFGYYSRLPILDYLGLVDPVISRSTDALPAGASIPVTIAGHARSNADYVFSRDPDLILVSEKGASRVHLLPAVLAIWNHPELDRCYRYEPPLRGYRRRPHCDEDARERGLPPG